MKITQFDKKLKIFEDIELGSDSAGVPDINESNELAEAGDTIRTNKNGMDGKVEKADGDTVFFRIADGRLMKTPQSNVTVVQKLADEAMNESDSKGKRDTNKEWRNSARDASKEGNKWSPTNLPNYTGGKKKEASKRGSTTEGVLGGINRAAPSQNVSYEKVLDEVTTKYRVDELSVGTMKAYKDAATSDKSMNTRPLRKIAHTVAGVKQASDKIRTKTGDRRGQGGNIVMANLEERLAQFVKEVDMSQFQDILNKQHAEKPVAKKVKTVDIEYHGWNIRYAKPAGPGENVRWQVMDKANNITKRGESQTERDAVQDAQEYIRTGPGQSKKLSGAATIDFNVNFAREFAPEGETFYAKIERQGKGPVLKFSSMPKEGWKRSHIRNQKDKITGTTTKLPMIPMSAVEANAAGLEPHGRYMLGDKEQIDDNTAIFPLIMQGKTQSKTDTVRMGKPGITVATDREVDEAMASGTSPWAGNPKKLARSPKSAMQGTEKISFSGLVQDTIKKHGLKWAFEFYVKKHGLPPREFRVFAGI